MPSPRQTFEDNIRPAQLLLHVYRLFDTNNTTYDYDGLAKELKGIVGAQEDEYVQIIINEIFFANNPCQFPSYLRSNFLIIVFV